MSAPRVLVVQHEAQCPPAWLGSWLGDEGCDLDISRPYAGDQLPGDLLAHDALLVLGGSMGANDQDALPWLRQVTALVREAARDDVPTLGVCLGHQLCAVALGGQVAPNPLGQQLGLTEIGWTPAADDDRLIPSGWRPRRGVHWNHDVVTVAPPGTAVLAATHRGKLQVARFAATVWGVQLHPEADETIVAPWADQDRPAYPAGVVDAALDAIAAAREELESTWRRLAESFATLSSSRVRGLARRSRGHAPLRLAESRAR